MKYAGQKAVDKWIKDNLFDIHEYAHNKSGEIRAKIELSLIQTLSGKRKPIKIECTTKLGDWIRIDYTPGGKYSPPKATILIDRKIYIRP